MTVRVKLCIAALPTPLLAVKVIGYVPPVPAAGVRLSTPVAGVNVTPLGNAPLSLSVGVGIPVAVHGKAAIASHRKYGVVCARDGWRSPRPQPGDAVARHRPAAVRRERGELTAH